MLPEDLTTWRALMGLTQSDAARELGMSLRQYSNYERGLAAIPLKIDLAAKALAARAAHIKPKRDGRYGVPIDWEAHGKVIFVYQAGREVGHDPANTKDPSGRWRAKDEAACRELMKHWLPLEIEERADGWHVAINGSAIPK